MNTSIPITRFKAAIFDMDGTMINNMAYHKRDWQAFLKKHNITLTEEEFRNKISREALSLPACNIEHYGS